MSAPLPFDIIAAIDKAREFHAAVDIDRVANELAEAFVDHDNLIELMLKRVVIAECRRAGIPMRLGA